MYLNRFFVCLRASLSNDMAFFRAGDHCADMQRYASSLRLENTTVMYNKTTSTLTLTCINEHSFDDERMTQNISCGCSHNLTSWIDDVSALGTCRSQCHSMFHKKSNIYFNNIHVEENTVAVSTCTSDTNQLLTYCMRFVCWIQTP